MNPALGYIFLVIALILGFLGLGIYLFFKKYRTLKIKYSSLDENDIDFSRNLD